MARPFTARPDGVVARPRKAVMSADAGTAVSISRRQETGARTKNLRIPASYQNGPRLITWLAEITRLTKIQTENRSSGAQEQLCTKDTYFLLISWPPVCLSFVDPVLLVIFVLSRGPL
jgi:hypothetical protein